MLIPASVQVSAYFSTLSLKAFEKSLWLYIGLVLVYVLLHVHFLSGVTSCQNFIFKPAHKITKRSNNSTYDYI